MQRVYRRVVLMIYSGVKSNSGHAKPQRTATTEGELMAGKSQIEWTDSTWNPVTGCSKVSAGCKNCYAKKLWPRLSYTGNKSMARPSGPYAGRKFEDVACHPERLEIPLHWAKSRMVFVNSMSDLFHNAVPFDFIDRVFAVMALASQHKFQILTKRAKRMREYLGDPEVRNRVYDVAMTISGGCYFIWPLPNVWGLVSVENQKTADLRIPDLLATPFAVRGVSYEPALGPVDSGRWMPTCFSCAGRLKYRGPDWVCDECGHTDQNVGGDFIDWVICGGESGPGARPMEVEWARSVRDQCQAAGVAFFFKQGSKANWPDYKNFESFPKDLQIREYPNAGR